jgi:hypothetical protein
MVIALRASRMLCASKRELVDPVLDGGSEPVDGWAEPVDHPR